MNVKEWIAGRPPLPNVSSLEEAKALALKKYPIYTIKHPNPETGKPDCPIEKRFKDAAREAYTKILMNASA